MTPIDDVSNEINHFLSLSCQSIDLRGDFHGLPSSECYFIDLFFLGVLLSAKWYSGMSNRSRGGLPNIRHRAHAGKKSFY